MKFQTATLASLVAGLLVAGATSAVSAQVTAKKPNGIEQVVPEFESASLQLYSRVPMIRYLFQNELASADGHYLAQNKEELQTYQDLGLAYQYFDSPLLRRQLQLPKRQGIMIADVDSDGQGSRCGLQAGDIVLSIDQVNVVTQYELVIELTRNRGDERRARLKRDGKEMELTFNLTELNLNDENDKRFILGVHADSLSDALKSQLQTNGLLVTGVTEEGPAKKAGLQAYDIIVRLNKARIEDAEGLREALKKSNGEKVTVEYLRNAKSRTVEITPSVAEMNSVEVAEQWLQISPVLSQAGVLELKPVLQAPGKLQQVIGRSLEKSFINPVLRVPGKLQLKQATLPNPLPKPLPYGGHKVGQKTEGNTTQQRLEAILLQFKTLEKQLVDLQKELKK